MATYFGCSTGEAYSDKRNGAYVGLFDSDADSEYVDYIFSQEHGSHCDSDWLEASGEGRYLKVQAVGKPFSFNLFKYTSEELESKAHNFEPEKSGYTVLCIDYKQNGIGSGSCGPVPFDNYIFSDAEFDISFVLIPE